MHLYKDWQSLCGGLVGVDEFALVDTGAKQGLKDEHLGCVVVPVQLLEVAMLVSEHAARAIHARLRVVERTAVVRLELFIVANDGRLGQFVLSVGEATAVLVATLGSLDPVLAELGLVLAIRVSHLRHHELLLLMHHHHGSTIVVSLGPINVHWNKMLGLKVVYMVWCRVERPS